MRGSGQANGVALVTGAAQRIGRALAVDLGRAGWRVAVHHRSSPDAAGATAEAIRTAGGTAHVMRADLSRREDVEALVSEAAVALGPVTCLVNNASEFRFDDIATMTHASWDAHIGVNLAAPVFLAQAMARQLPSGADGVVVNLIDQRVWKLTPEFFSYTLAKAALWDATRMLAQALAPRIRVNAIGPGPVLRSVHQTEADFEAERTGTLLGRGTTPEEIAAALRFILDAPAMTGQMIALDGGQHLAWSSADTPASLAGARSPGTQPPA